MYNKNIIFSTLNLPLLKEIHQGKGFKCGMDVRWSQTDRNCRRLFKYNSTVCVVNTGGALVGRVYRIIIQQRATKKSLLYIGEGTSMSTVSDSGKSKTKFNSKKETTLVHVSLMWIVGHFHCYFFFKLYCNYAWLWVDDSPMCPGMPSVSLWIRDSRVWGDMGNRSLVFPEFVLQEKQTNKRKFGLINEFTTKRGFQTLCANSHNKWTASRHTSHWEAACLNDWLMLKTKSWQC